MRLTPITLLAMLLALVACAINVTNPLSESTAVTFSQPGFWLEPGATLYWRSERIYIYDDPGRKPDNVQPYLKQEIQGYLETEKFQFVDDRNLARYGLVAVIVLGDEVTARDIMKQFGLTPSFNATRFFKKGTIVVALLDAASEEIVWRGSLEANISLSVSPGVRQQRVRQMTHKLLDKLPRRESLLP